MNFENGHKKIGGRAKETPNKVTKEARDLFIHILSEEVGNIKDSLERIRKDNPYKYLLIIGKLLPYIIPKLNPKDLIEKDPITQITLVHVTKNLDYLDREIDPVYGKVN